MAEKRAWDVGFVCLVEPEQWYARFRDDKLPRGLKYLIFQLECCAATGVLCVRGYAQTEEPKKMSTWRHQLQLDDASVLEPRPGASYKMAESCMVAGFDIDGKFWTVSQPHVIKGRLYISPLEQIAMDIEDGQPLAALALRYPKQWRCYGRGFEAYERITRGTQTPTDWQCGNQMGMSDIVHTAYIHYQHAERRKRGRDHPILPDRQSRGLDFLLVAFALPMPAAWRAAGRIEGRDHGRPKHRALLS